MSIQDSLGAGAMSFEADQPVPPVPRWVLEEQRALDGAAPAARRGRAPQLRAVKSDPRPLIRLEPGERPRIVSEVQTVLARAGGLYKRSGFVMRGEQQPETGGDDERIRRAVGALVLVEVDEDWLAIEMGRVARWEKYDARSEEYKLTDPPAALARAVIACSGEWSIPPVRGIVRAPTLRRDGSLISEPGFDQQSGLLIDFDAAAIPPINPAPGRAAAEAALAMLRDALGEFPFARPEAESAALAAIIGALVRPALPSAPAIGITASTAGTGKTELAIGVIGQIATGVAPAACAVARSEEEMQKAMLGLLVAGDPVIVLDNASRAIESDALCSIITEPSVKWRWLGGNRNVRATTNTTLVLTGNGLEIVGDLTTRLLMIELDAAVERPDERTFSRADLKSWIGEHRGELVRAALIIPLAYQAAGSPVVARRSSRFHTWDRLVRDPLLWLGLADPLNTQLSMRARDPEREALAAVLHAIAEEFGEKEWTVGELVRRAAGQIGAAALAGRQIEEGSLADAVITVATGGQGGNISSKRLGRYLTKRLRRIVEGLRLEDAGEDPVAHARRYRIDKVEVAEPEPDADEEADAEEEKWKKEEERATAK